MKKWVMRKRITKKWEDWVHGVMGYEELDN